MPLVDDDADGIDDRLEGSAGCYPHLIVGHDDSHLDTDGDCRSDATEIADMTDLYDPTDSFRILSFTPALGFDPETNPLFTVTVKTFPGLESQLPGAANCHGDTAFTVPLFDQFMKRTMPDHI